MQKTMTFTGPRPKDLYGYGSHKDYAALMTNLKDAVRKACHEGYTTFITGGAQGFDQLAFWAVQSIKNEGYAVSNVVYVPMDGQETPWRCSDGPFSQDEYHQMLRMADRVEVLNPQPSDWHEAARFLNARNARMLDDADCVTVCLRPGMTPDKLQHLPCSGTANCYRDAMRRRMPVRFVAAPIITKR